MKYLKYFESFEFFDPLLRNSEYIINEDDLVVIKVNSFEDMVTLGKAPIGLEQIQKMVNIIMIYI